MSGASFASGGAAAEVAEVGNKVQGCGGLRRLMNGEPSYFDHMHQSLNSDHEESRGPTREPSVPTFDIDRRA